MSQIKPEWDSVDAKAWREFLDTQTGRRLQLRLAQDEPDLLARGETNDILIRSGEVRQHRAVISLLLFLTGEIAEVKQVDISPAYPPLDDDKYWEGDKLNSPTT